MALQTQIVQVAFAEGADESIDKRHLPQGKLLRAVNARLSKLGAIEKRQGIEVLGAVETGGLTAGLMTRGDEVLVADTHGRLSSYSPATGEMATKGSSIRATVLREGLFAAAQEAYEQDIAYGNGVTVTVFLLSDAGPTNPGRVHILIRDESGAQVALERSTITNAVCPRVCFVAGGTPANQFVVVYGQTGSNTVYRRTISSSFVVGAETAFIANNRAGGDIEVCAMSNRFGLVYQPAAGTNPVVHTYSSAVSLLQSVTVAEPTATVKTGFGLEATTSESIWASWVQTVGGFDVAYATCINSATFVERAGFPLVAYTISVSGGSRIMYTAPKRRTAATATIALSGVQLEAMAVWAPVVSTAGVVLQSAGTRFTLGATLASEPYVDPAGDEGLLAMVLTTPPLHSRGAEVQRSHLVVDLRSTYAEGDAITLTGTPVTGLVAAGFSAAVLDSARFDLPGRPASAVDLGDSRFATVGRQKLGNDRRTGLFLATIDHASTDRWQFAQANGTIGFTPGAVYDGSSMAGPTAALARAGATEIGFLTSPQGLTATVSGSGSMAAGDYAYTCLYEEPDAAGNVARSGIAPPVVATVGALGRVELTMPALTITGRQEASPTSTSRGVSVVVYRTTVDGTTAGPFYRLGAVKNDPAGDSVSFVDTYADTTVPTPVGTLVALDAQPTVYTTGGVLENVSPSSMHHVVAHAGRHWYVGDDGRTLAASKAIVEGDAVSFCDEFTVPLPTSERVRALASMDGTLAAFTQSRIFVLPIDDGPNDLGTGAQWPLPRALATDLGCIESRSVVLMPAGLMFQSTAGLYLLTRGLEVTNVGLPVEDTLAANPTVTSAIVHPTDSLVEFTCAGGEGGGVRLVFDYRLQQWTVDELQGGQPFASQVVAGGRVYLLGALGSVYQESLTSYLDEDGDGDGAWVTMTVELANVKLGGLQGYQRTQRVWLLGEKYTAHDLLIELAHDYSATFTQLVPIVSSRIDATPLEQQRVVVGRQKGQSIRVRVSDAEPTGVGAVLGLGRGFALQGIAFRIGVTPRGNPRLGGLQKS